MNGLRGRNETTLPDAPSSAPRTEQREHALYIVSSIDGGAVGRRIELSKQHQLLIGRRVERDGISVDDSRMSRVHARVFWDSRCKRFRVADLESANGVWANGERQRVVELTPRTALRLGRTVFVYSSRDLMADVVERARLAAGSVFSVLIHGETGTGKEHLAHAIHAHSGRDGAFVAVNCAVFSRELLAAELFGHTKNAFSGASVERPGLFRAAQRGTLFLDEIGDMPIDLQPALLRVLQERSVRPVGSDREVPVDVRVVAATHRDLAGLVGAGRFRADLRARLCQVELEVPPLRERAYQLPALIRTLAERLGITVEVSPEAMAALIAYDWKDNVRELESLLARLKLFGRAPYALDHALLEQEAPAMLAAATPSWPSLGTPVAPSSVPPGHSREELTSALDRHGGRVAEVARELSTSRTQVYRWLKRWGVGLPSTRDA